MKKYYLLLLIALGACWHGRFIGEERTLCPVPDKKEEEMYCPMVKIINTNVETQYALGVIGEIEPVFLKNMNSVFYARIDTGAETSSIDAKNIKRFERDGERWVSFDVENRETKETYNFQKKIKRTTGITNRHDVKDKRIVVDMEIKMGNQLLVKEFTLADRENFDYQVLIGRNILGGLAIVDVNTKKTLNSN